MGTEFSVRRLRTSNRSNRHVLYAVCTFIQLWIWWDDFIDIDEWDTRRRIDFTLPCWCPSAPALRFRRAIIELKCGGRFKRKVARCNGGSHSPSCQRFFEIVGEQPEKCVGCRRKRNHVELFKSVLPASIASASECNRSLGSRRQGAKN